MKLHGCCFAWLMICESEVSKCFDTSEQAQGRLRRLHVDGQASRTGCLLRAWKSDNSMYSRKAGFQQKWRSGDNCTLSNPWPTVAAKLVTESRLKRRWKQKPHQQASNHGDGNEQTDDQRNDGDPQTETAFETYNHNEGGTDSTDHSMGSSWIT